ncbi:hypothetical protein Neosp_011862 [[Neocosmospora] mangrovei]
MESSRVLRVGLIGCGEVAQVIHVPTLGFLSHLFRLTYLCDVSDQALQHVKSRVPNSGEIQTTNDPDKLCRSADVDVVLVLSSDEYHAHHAILALGHDKYVMIEKPAALNLQDLQQIKKAEEASKGRVMVGYMRRYASAFRHAVDQVGGLDKILYARVRDIIGQPQPFVSQSGTYPKRFNDFRQQDMDDLAARSNKAFETALTECPAEPSDENRLFWRYLGGLGSHDLSAMRETLGMPIGIHGASVTMPFWNVLFKYPGFNVSYESGIDNVPRFDCHIEVYGTDKTIRVQFDTPYIKGLPVTMHISENVAGAYRETTTRVTYEDAYTLELKELYEWVTTGKKIKTDLVYAEQDLRIMGMIMKAL